MRTMWPTQWAVRMLAFGFCCSAPVCLSLGCYGVLNAMAPSFSGLGRRPFTALTRVRIPLGSRNIERCFFQNEMLYRTK
jgi:hypothetical protein